MQPITNAFLNGDNPTSIKPMTPEEQMFILVMIAITFIITLVTIFYGPLIKIILRDKK